MMGIVLAGDLDDQRILSDQTFRHIRWPDSHRDLFALPGLQMDYRYINQEPAGWRARDRNIDILMMRTFINYPNMNLDFISRCNADFFFFDGYSEVTFVPGLIRLSVHNG